MDTIQFSSAVLTSFTRKPAGGSAKFRASLTKEVIEKMTWQEIPDCFTGTKLDGVLNADNLMLTPNEDALEKHGIEVDIKKVHSFETVRLELNGSKGKGHRVELRFTVDFAGKSGAALFESYMEKVGDAKAKARVSYVKQQLLPGTE